MMTNAVQRVAERWNTQDPWKVGRGNYWLELRAVQRRLNEKVSGQPDVDWVLYTLERHFAGRLPLDRCLSLGCGRGGLERRLASLGAFVACDAHDIAEASLAEAEAAARQAGYEQIHYAVQDANRMQLAARSYDAVWASGAAHHFERLEHVFEQVAAALKPGGLFVLNEYVGPSRFQFPARQRHVMEACFELLPVEYRRLTATASTAGSPASGGRVDWRWVWRRLVGKARDGDLVGAVGRRLRRWRAVRRGARPVKTTLSLPTARSVQAVDPSEAVRSAEIVPLLRRYFEIVELRPLGGSILQFLLADIAGNFEDAGGGQLLEMLFAVEDALMDSGDLDSDFAYIVATPLRTNEQMPGPGGREG